MLIMYYHRALSNIFIMPLVEKMSVSSWFGKDAWKTQRAFYYHHASSFLESVLLILPVS